MKKYVIIPILFITIILTTGCIKRDTMEGINVYTSVYPIEFITERLYGENATINSIYPNGINIKKYKLTNKQIKDYSESDLFIYNGLSEEKNYAIEMLNNNSNLKIIDSAANLEVENSVDELWLDPSNFLMLSQNTKNGLNEYITNPYLKKEINENYEDLKIEVSKIDAELKLMAENSEDKTLVFADDTFNFLKKYDFTIISLAENDNLNAKTINDVVTMIQRGKIKYIFTKQYEKESNTIKQIKALTNVEVVPLNTAANLTDAERTEKKDYLQIMNENVELLRKEAYK